jgi:uncharacterized membrane protein
VMNQDMSSMMGLGPSANFLLATLFLIMVVAGAILVGKSVLFPGDRPAGSAGALDELKARYARGEIDREEFLRIKRDIEG